MPPHRRRQVPPPSPRWQRSSRRGGACVQDDPGPGPRAASRRPEARPTAGILAVRRSAGGPWRRCYRTGPARPGNRPAAPWRDRAVLGQARDQACPVRAGHRAASPGQAMDLACRGAAMDLACPGGPRDRAAPVRGEGRADRWWGRSRQAAARRLAPGLPEPHIRRSSPGNRSARIRNTYRTACALSASINAPPLMWPFAADMITFVTLGLPPSGCRNHRVGGSPFRNVGNRWPEITSHFGGRRARRGHAHRPARRAGRGPGRTAWSSLC